VRADLARPSIRCSTSTRNFTPNFSAIAWLSSMIALVNCLSKTGDEKSA
jgi:hypothetical protein